ncbi:MULTISPECIES: hypothetical protein [unclassified Pseudovibrio]|uniref:hypothetical protein n=1 Tax=unclassified Pseudovibrio TaxID=2627060 RepID=UPI0007AEB06E|nr:MULTISPECIES: hypothetical protein [unclassified Pseudovibrio]KZK94225.1 hypothetical protein PsW74_04885 [Pseudovibrio sp. W74]KZL07756.1 hypothetical protein PsAD14_04146 [Pseudovibrio sp. Ad14]
MTGVSFSSSSQLSDVLTQIDHPANREFVKENAQVRITGGDVRDGETIYSAETKDGSSKVSKASLAKLTGGKLFGNALQTHDKKLNNWHVFTQLAKNEISAGLEKGGLQNHQAKTGDILTAAFDKVQSNPTYHSNDVRFGALQELSTTIKSLVADALSDASTYEQISVNSRPGHFIDTDGSLVLPNSLYGSAYSDVSGDGYSLLGGEGVPDEEEYATVRFEGELNKPELGDQQYAAVNKRGGDKEGAPILRHYTPNQLQEAAANERREAAGVLADIDRQVIENENPYNRLNFNTGPLAEPGSVLLDETYATIDQSQADSRWGEKVSTVNNEPLYVNSGVESAVENSSEYSDVLLGDDQAIYGNLTRDGRPAPLPKPAAGDIPPVPPKRDASLQ